MGIRLGLVSDLLRAERIDEAFAHLAVAWRLAADDPLDAALVHRALRSIMTRFERQTGLDGAAPAGGEPNRPNASLGPASEPGRNGGDYGDPSSPVRAAPDGGDVAAGLDVEFRTPEVTVGDVAGLEDVKGHLERVVFAPLRNPDLAAAFGRTPSGGMILWGPPGCGKTFLAKALAGSMAVSFASVAMDDVLDMWLGNSEKNLASLFTAARMAAPCVLFFDEVDALGGRRSRMGAHAGMRSVVSQLLVETDGVGRDNSGVFVVGATNLPWDVDPALRRPGRFDRTIFVPPPDLPARVAIIASRLAEVPFDPNLRVERAAQAMAGFSGADVFSAADLAIDLAFEESVRQAPASRPLVQVGQLHLDAAVAASTSSIADWIQITKMAAEASADLDLFGPFLDWARRNGEA